MCIRDSTKAYAKNAQVVVMKADADYSSTADLVGKTIVAEAGSAGESAISEDESLSQADYVSKSVQTDCLMEVAAGTADAAVLDLTLATAMIGEGTDYANLAIKDLSLIHISGQHKRLPQRLQRHLNEPGNMRLIIHDQNRKHRVFPLSLRPV